MLTSLNTEGHAVCEKIVSAGPDTPLLVDFDETLFLRNSTEEYLSAMKPRILALLILKVLEYLRPWNVVFGRQRGPKLRDWIRVLLMSTLFPWSLLAWPKRAKSLAKTYENTVLSQPISQSSSQNIIVASNGFDFIIRPILKHMSISCDRLVACRSFMGFQDRQDGKKRLLEQHLSSDVLADSILVTDSLDDQELLDFVRHPYLVEWNSEQFSSSIPPGYFPFFYLEKIKKANQNFFVRSILVDEFIPFIFLFAWPQPNPLIFGLGLLFLHVSFWLIYEMGYMENDLIAETYEKNPTLSQYYLWGKNRIDFVRPWFWSLSFGAAALFIWNVLELKPTDWSNVVSFGFLKTLTVDLGLWGLYLLLTRAVYRLYNYINEASRIWLYPVLQALKFSGFFIFIPVTPLAIAYLLALVNSRWIPYAIYRCGGLKAYPDFPTQLAQLFGFLVIGGLLCLSGSSSSFLSLQAVILFSLSMGLASRQVLELFRSATFLKAE